MTENQKIDYKKICNDFLTYLKEKDPKGNTMAWLVHAELVDHIIAADDLVKEIKEIMGQTKNEITEN